MIDFEIDLTGEDCPDYDFEPYLEAWAYVKRDAYDDLMIYDVELADPAGRCIGSSDLPDGQFKRLVEYAMAKAEKRMVDDMDVLWEELHEVEREEAHEWSCRGRAALGDCDW